MISKGKSLIRDKEIKIDIIEIFNIENIYMFISYGKNIAYNILYPYHFV